MVAPNRMIANGNQAIDGMVCSAVIIEPTAARSGLIRDTSAPSDRPDDQGQREPDHGAAAWWCRWPARAARGASGPTGRRRPRPGPGRMSLLPAAEVDELPGAEHDRDRQQLGPDRGPDLAARGPRRSRPGGSSRLSSPARAAASGRPPWPRRWLRCQLAMADHLLPQPVGDGAGQPGDLGRVDPPRAADRHRELVDDPAWAAAEHAPPGRRGGPPPARCA